MHPDYVPMYRSTSSELTYEYNDLLELRGTFARIRCGEKESVTTENGHAFGPTSTSVQ